MSSASPGPHPLPSDLRRVALPLVERDAPWYRHHKPEFGPIFFGRTGECRFDAPPPDRAYGVLYLAADVHCAFVETFGHGHVGRGRLLHPRARPGVGTHAHRPHGAATL